MIQNREIPRRSKIFVELKKIRVSGIDESKQTRLHMYIFVILEALSHHHHRLWLTLFMFKLYEYTKKKSRMYGTSPYTQPHPRVIINIMSLRCFFFALVSCYFIVVAVGCGSRCGCVSFFTVLLSSLQKSAKICCYFNKIIFQPFPLCSLRYCFCAQEIDANARLTVCRNRIWLKFSSKLIKWARRK